MNDKDYITIDGAERLPVAQFLPAEKKEADAMGLLMDMRNAAAEYAEQPLDGVLYLIFPEGDTVVGGMSGKPERLLLGLETVAASIRRELARLGGTTKGQR